MTGPERSTYYKTVALVTILSLLSLAACNPFDRTSAQTPTPTPEPPPTFVLPEDYAPLCVYSMATFALEQVCQSMITQNPQGQAADLQCACEKAIIEEFLSHDLRDLKSNDPFTAKEVGSFEQAAREAIENAGGKFSPPDKDNFAQSLLSARDLMELEWDFAINTPTSPEKTD